MTELVTQKRIPEARLESMFVTAGLIAFVAVTYILVVLGGGALIGHTSSPDTRLSIVATLVVALGLGPMQTYLQSLARRVLDGGRELPYEVLSRFSGAVTRSEEEDVPATMARVLAQGTGVAWAQVWLLVGHAPVLAATWPEGAAGGQLRPLTGGREPDGQRTLLVGLGGETLGALRIQERPHQPLTPVEERLFDGLAAQAGLVLHGERLRTQLARRVDELSARADELRASRGRIVEAQDAGRRRLERDIHDGAQQHLVALAVNLRLAQALAASAPDAATGVLAEQVAATDAAIQTLVDLSQGIYPAELSEHGIGQALAAATRAAPLAVQVVDRTHGRYEPATELAVYFCCLEAIQNAVKHAGGTHVRVTVEEEHGQLVAAVRDNGAGFDLPHTLGGSGLGNMRDRLDTVGGWLVVESAPGSGTVVTARVRLPPGPAS
jgi:signal transduction histidine kinase